MNPIFIVVIVALWLYMLRAFRRAELHAWHFLGGSMGLFIFLMVVIQPMLAQLLAQCVSAMAGLVGSLTNTFTAYFKYGIIFSVLG